ncbi:hypothetical protein [Thioalkalivibrio sulfidiphilus]|uniref:hypothetical protein n=1 Tax=Thioalkalivibrio sulfidiphilus TaxID=1033854 RepID=UPI00037520EE|nr:hypothetical protein [Thioalkalivibrio sulfidiphilus]
MNADLQRLQRLIDLVNREDEHLLGVRARLLNDDCVVNETRLEQLLSNDLGIDRLESFGAKFGRMQDTIMDKLIPALLEAAGEPILAAIDNLEKMERLRLIDSADAWLQIRRLRNRLVHEYFEKPSELAPALQRACEFTDQMHLDFQSMRRYAAEHLGVQAP